VKILKYITCIMLCAIISVSAQDIPKFNVEQEFVQDHAGILTSEQRDKLNVTLKAHEQATSNEIIVHIIKSLEGLDVQEYVAGVFEKWKPGKKEKDNGVIVFFSLQEKRMNKRIHVGYGLEGSLNDAKCGRILDKQMIPLLNEGKYAESVDATVTRIIEEVNGEYEGEGGKVKYVTTFGPFALPLILAAIFCLFHRVAGGFAGSIGYFCVGWWKFGLLAGIGLGFVGFFVGLIALEMCRFGLSAVASGAFSGGSGGSAGGGGASR